MRGKVIGIDLGTTNSVVAVLEGDQPTIIVNQEGSRVTPSVVAVANDGGRLVGQIARRQAVTNPEHTVFSIKRFMGRKHHEVEAEVKRVPYQVVPAANGDVRVELRGKKYSPPAGRDATIARPRDAGRRDDHADPPQRHHPDDEARDLFDRDR